MNKLSVLLFCICLILISGVVIADPPEGGSGSGQCPIGQIPSSYGCCVCWWDSVYEVRCYCRNSGSSYDCYYWTDGLICIPLDYQQ